MKYLLTLMLVLGAVIPASAAEERASLGESYRAGLVHLERKCAGRAPGEVTAGQSQIEKLTVLAERSTCMCIPAKIRSVLATLPTRQLATQVTTSEFLAMFKAEVQDKCTVEYLRGMYATPTCETLHADSVADTGKFCRCMRALTGKYRDAELAAVGGELDAYTHRAAEAQKRGEPAPAMSPAQAYFTRERDACKAQ